MQKYRSFRSMMKSTAVVIGAALGIILAAPAAMADSYLGSTSQAEQLGCQSDGYKTIGTPALVGPAGNNRSDVGYVQILWRPSPSNPNDVRVCAITKHGSLTNGKALYTVLEVGTQPVGGGTQDIRFWDRGTYSYNAGGVAITPSSGRCAVVHGRIDYAGSTYSVWFNQFDAANSVLCN